MTKQITMLVGVAGAGKSTWCEYNKHNIDKVFSSDAIRIELFGSLEYQLKHHHAEVFHKLHSDMKSYIFDHEDEDFYIVYDATNLTFNKRYYFYQHFKEYVDIIHAVVFTHPLQYLLDVNKQRATHKQVPIEKIESMYETMTIPFINVDCDSIEGFGTPIFKRKCMKDIIRDDNENLVERVAFYKTKMKKELKGINVSHHSKYHTETIQEHINEVIHYADSDLMKLVAIFHDLGKPITRKKNIDGTDNFHNHEKVSAMYLFNYLTMYYREQYAEKGEYLVKMVAYHMLPFTSISNRKLRKRGIDNKLWQDLNHFNTFDRKSSHPQ